MHRARTIAAISKAAEHLSIFEIARVLVRVDHIARFIVNAITALRERPKNLAYPTALVAAFSPPYRSRPNGSASEIRLMPQ